MGSIFFPLFFPPSFPHPFFLALSLCLPLTLFASLSPFYLCCFFPAPFSAIHKPHNCTGTVPAASRAPDCRPLLSLCSPPQPLASPAQYLISVRICREPLRINWRDVRLISAPADKIEVFFLCARTSTCMCVSMRNRGRERKRKVGKMFQKMIINLQSHRNILHACANACCVCLRITIL